MALINGFSESFRFVLPLTLYCIGKGIIHTGAGWSVDKKERFCAEEEDLLGGLGYDPPSQSRSLSCEGRLCEYAVQAVTRKWSSCG
ncbi:hypothetical protein [Edwardsiella ictaluri]|uniref:hypothetical protein n=1 Tax=Edwardsiella ictaluri TaxID=67780 RepID=UPI003593A85F